MKKTLITLLCAGLLISCGTAASAKIVKDKVMKEKVYYNQAYSNIKIAGSYCGSPGWRCKRAGCGSVC